MKSDVNVEKGNSNIIEILAKSTNERFHELAEKLAGEEPFVWLMTPDEAETLLTLANTYNRVPSPSKVKSYLGAMARGEWMYNNASLGFYVDGRIADGQHRLQAMSQSKKTIKTVIVPGLDPSCFQTIDLGKNRTARDAFEMEGHAVPGIKAIACTIALKWMLNKRIASTATPSTSQILKFESSHRTIIRGACGLSVAWHEEYGSYLHPGLVAGTILIRHLAKMRTEDEFTSFLEEIYSGEAKTPRSPGFVARKLIEKHLVAKNKKAGKMTQEGVVGTLLKAYKLAESGREAMLDTDVMFPARPNEKFSVCL
jgi:hypothetical protein